MTDKPRPRKHVYKTEGAWRAKRQANQAGHKLSRDAILSLYTRQPAPNFPDYEDLQLLILPEGVAPSNVRGAQFSHSLGTELNSRKQQPPREKRPEATPEWYTEETAPPPIDPVAMLFKDAAEAEFPVPRPANALTEEELLNKQRQESIPKRKEPVKIVVEAASGVKNFPQTPLLDSLFCSVTPAKPTKELPVEIDFEEKFSNIDNLYEAKLKAALEEDDVMPEWDEPAEVTDLPKMPDRQELLKGKPEPVAAQPPKKLPMALMNEQLAIGNPFAPIVVENCVPDNDDFIWPPSYSHAHDKTWYYKDPNYVTQGPFDSIEMFNWYTAGFFKHDLPLSTSSRGPYIPLSMYSSNRYPYNQYALTDAFESEPPKTLAEVEQKQKGFSVPFAKKSVAAKPKKAQVCENSTKDLKNLLGL